MILGIHAANIRTGGGLTHLVNLLRHAEPEAVGFRRVVVWGTKAVLSALESSPWLELQGVDWLMYTRTDAGVVRRILEIAWPAHCDVMFVPGGYMFVPGGHAFVAGVPVVSLFQNMLPFDAFEMSRYWPRGQWLRLRLLRVLMERTFVRARGIVFLSEYARQVIKRVLGSRFPAESPVIPHGIARAFRCQPRPQRPPSAYSWERPFRLLYVSTIDLYKHQWVVAEAVATLRREGIPVTLDLVGPSYRPAMQRLERTLAGVERDGRFIRLRGALAHDVVADIYKESDAFVFASSCENNPNILLEAMASGLPIGCSDRGPMPEVLGEGGVYFDPECPAAIARALRQLFESTELRQRLAQTAYKRAQQHTWPNCAERLMQYLAEVARQGGR